MMRIVFIIFMLGVVPAFAQYGWQNVDTVTTGNCDDLNPQVDHGGDSPYYFRSVTDDWVIFERWNSSTSSIAAVKYLGRQLRWDANVCTISPPMIGVTQEFPDVCTVSRQVFADSTYVWKSFTLAAWQEKSDSVWNIYYSTCNPDSSNWSTPVQLTQNSGNNENPEVRALTDTSLIILWRRDSTICYSIAGSNGASAPKVLAVSNTDSTEFDFCLPANYGGQGALVWTRMGNDDNRYCLIDSVSAANSMTVSVTDSVVLDGDIQNPRFMVSFSPVFAFDLRESGRYQAWMASYGGYPTTWQSSLVAGGSNSDNLHLAFYVPALLTANHKALAKGSQMVTYGFSVWERQTGSDTSLVFSNADTISTPGFNRNPSISSSVYSYNPSGHLMIGFAVFESNRTGRSHIYARYFVYSLGVVDGQPPAASDFRLYQNYPNPFNPITTISYQLSAVSHVTLNVYDVLGREVRTLVDANQTPGGHSVVFDSRGLASGVYFYRLRTGNYVIVNKMTLLK